jgi:hypothetical protein
MNNTIQIRVKGGYIVASVSSDPNYPGIDVEYVADDDNGERVSRPRVLVEYPVNDCLRALIWNEPDNEDYTEEIDLL